MNPSEYLDQNKEIQNNILDYIENDENYDEAFQNLIAMINDKNIQNDKHDLSSLFHLVTKIANNHHHNTCFFEKNRENFIDFFKRHQKIFFKFRNIQYFQKYPYL